MGNNRLRIGLICFHVQKAKLMNFISLLSWFSGSWQFFWWLLFPGEAILDDEEETHMTSTKSLEEMHSRKGVRTVHTEWHLRVVTLRSCSPRFSKSRGRETAFGEESYLKDVTWHGSTGWVRLYWGRGRRGRCGRENTFWAQWETGLHFMGRMARVLDLKCFPQVSGRPKRYDSGKNRVLRLTSEVKKSGPFGSATHVGGRSKGTAGKSLASVACPHKH